MATGLVSARVPDQARSNTMMPTTDDPTAAVLDLLIGEHPGLLHVDKLPRLYACGSVEHDEAARIVDDAVSDLLASGLAHRFRRFVSRVVPALLGRHLAR